MKKLLIATKNPGKIREMSAFLSDLPLELVSLKDVGITEDVEETGITYFENSKKKALFYAQKSGLPAVSDDGGLEIAALNGAPGVKSRRWLGYEATDEELVEYMKKVARELSDDNRKATFKTVVTLATPEGKVFQELGEIEGIIAKEPNMKVLRGYPYRSFFYLPQIQKYYHESDLPEEEMMKYNHRRKAIDQLKKTIRKIYDL